MKQISKPSLLISIVATCLEFRQFITIPKKDYPSAGIKFVSKRKIDQIHFQRWVALRQKLEARMIVYYAAPLSHLQKLNLIQILSKRMNKISNINLSFLKKEVIFFFKKDMAKIVFK